MGVYQVASYLKKSAQEILDLPGDELTYWLAFIKIEAEADAKRWRDAKGGQTRGRRR